tara:strand:- start:226 stop:399 length:174 start_codon:yes stop_codon:yes gene_type:complete
MILFFLGNSITAGGNDWSKRLNHPNTKVYAQTILPIEKKIYRESILRANAIIKSDTR